MIEYIIFIIEVFILFLFAGLRKRVNDLEEIIRSGASPVQEAPKETEEAPLPRPLAVEEEQLGPSSTEKFIEWLKENWLLKLGALLLLIGFGWFATYAFLNNWIGPMGRIVLGIVAGTLFLFFGWWRIKKYLNQGSIFLVLGSTIILLTLFAAREVYDFFTPVTALVAMFLSTAFVAVASVKNKSYSLALLSLVLAGIAPLFTNAESLLSSYLWLFSYLFVVVLGAIWITVITGQRGLTTAALILFACYSLPYFASSFASGDKGVLLLFAYAFSAVFFITNTAGILKLKGKEIMPDLMTASGNGILLLFWIMLGAQEEWKSLIISAWMIVFGAGAFLIFKITQRKEPFYVYAGVGVAMLAVATSAELEGAILTTAYAIEAGLISLVAYFAVRDLRAARLASILLIGPAVLSFNSIISQAWKQNVLHEDFLAIFVVGLTFLGLGLFFSRQSSEEEDSKGVDTLLLVAGSIFGYILLWLSLHTIFQNDNFAVMLSLIVYVIVGLMSYFYGLLNEKHGLRVYGGLLIGFVVVRLLVIDIWKMELSGRIITFFLIGTLLVGTAFFGRKK